MMSKFVNEKNPKEAEILRDIPLIYDKIDQCRRSQQDFRLNIETEERSILELTSLMEEDTARITAGKRPRYDLASMKDNVVRCKNNIQLFREYIEKENVTIKRFQDMLATLKDDLKKTIPTLYINAHDPNMPNEIVITKH